MHRVFLTFILLESHHESALCINYFSCAISRHFEPKHRPPHQLHSEAGGPEAGRDDADDQQSCGCANKPFRPGKQLTPRDHISKSPVQRERAKISVIPFEILTKSQNMH